MRFRFQRPGVRIPPGGPKMERRARQRAAFYFLSPSARETNPLGSESLRADQKWSVVRVSVRRSIFYPRPPGRRTPWVLNPSGRTKNGASCASACGALFFIPVRQGGKAPGFRMPTGERITQADKFTGKLVGLCYIYNKSKTTIA